MKKIMFLLLLATSVSAFSQSSGFGIKGGLNYGSTGELSGIIDRPINADNKVGYHVGFFGNLEFAGIFLQPELVYTRLNASYDDRSSGDADYNLSKLDIPVLLGLEILGPLNIKAGPSFQVVLNNDFDISDYETEDPENTFTVGYQLGVGVTLGQLGLDLRYEGAFKENNTIVPSNSPTLDNVLNIDSRPSQWILSLSYRFGNNN